MATQTDVQQLIQGLTPSSVNNGNPNTAYNNSPASLGGGTDVPMTDVYGNWFTPQVNPAANYTYTPLNLQLTPLPHMPLPTLGGGIGWAAPPVSTPPPTGGGGGSTPLPGTGGGLIGGGGTGSGGGGIGTGGGWNVTGPNTVTLPNFSGSFGGAGGGSRGTNYGGGINLSEVMDNAGNIDWKQVLDAATEVIPGLQGNFYDSTTGQIQWDALGGRLASILTGVPLQGTGNWYLEGSKSWDASNIGASLLTMVTGLPVNTIANYLGRLGAQKGWSDNNFLVDHYMDNVRNNLSNTQTRLNRSHDQMLSDYLSREASGVMNSMTQRNINSGYAKSNSKMDSILQEIQAKIDAEAAGKNLEGGERGNNISDGRVSPGAGVRNSTVGRPIGGNLSFSGGRAGYNNGVGAGTGFGASSFTNDSWGGVASGFGIGAGAGGSAGSYAVSDAMAANKKNRG